MVLAFCPASGQVAISKAMGMMKNYLLELLNQCSVENFGQDAIEWAIVSGLVHITYDLERDVHKIMSRYDEIIEGYRLSLAKEAHTSQRAPMERAVPRHRAKATSTSARKERAA